MRRASLTALVVVFSALAFGGTGKIVGTVVDEYGVPVPHINVEACPADVGFDLILPGTETDERGRFVLKITFSGHEATDRWRVYAYDEDERVERMAGFYPRPSEFLGNTDLRHAPVVTISQKTPQASVEVVLGAKAGALTGRVVGVPGVPLAPSFEFAKISDPENSVTYRYDNNADPYRILLPANTSITLRVSSPGYKAWSPTGIISVGSGQETTLEIQLEPEVKPPTK